MEWFLEDKKPLLWFPHHGKTEVLNGFRGVSVEDYCSWIHSLELLGRKVNVWVLRKHLSVVSFKMPASPKVLQHTLDYSVGASASLASEWYSHSSIRCGNQEESESRMHLNHAAFLWGRDLFRATFAVPQLKQMNLRFLQPTFLRDRDLCSKRNYVLKSCDHSSETSCWF